MKPMGLIKSTAVAAAALLASACAEPVKDVDRTQPNALKKALFSGTWYFARTVVDVPYEADWAFVGDRQEYLAGEDFPALKVRWRIEEDRLLACRADEVVVGSNSDGERPGDLEPGNTAVPSQTEEDKQNDEYLAGQKFPCRHPVASFSIQGHFDIQRDYNASTGEQSNTIGENSSDRPWYDRQFFRIDWTDLGVTDLGYNLNSIADLGVIKMQSPYYVQAETGDCRVQNADGTFDLSTCEEGYLPPVVQDDAILITNRMTISPSDGLYGCFYEANCTLNEIGMRYSFMRVPERPIEEQYVPLAYPDDHFERAGLWRIKKKTYTPGRGETDFKQYLATRWNIFKKWRDADGKPLANPSESGIRSIEYYLNREFPLDLKAAAFSMAKEWNDAFDGIYANVDVKTSCKVTCKDEAGSAKEGAACDKVSDTHFAMNDQCVFRLHENDGNKFLGDLRWNFIAFIEDASLGQPCGVGGPANDPETGEMVNGVAYIYGKACFDNIETSVMDMVDLLCAQMATAGETELPASCDGIDEDAFLRGRRILEIMKAQGKVLPVATPIRSLSATAAASGAATEQLVSLKGRMEELKNHNGMLDIFRNRLSDTHFARALVTDEMALEHTHGRAKTGSDLTDEELKALNPLAPMKGKWGQDTARKNMLAARAIEPAEYLFNDTGLWAFALRNRDLNRSEFRHLLRREAFRSVTLHELGHNMGLRHNFIASFDRVNYFPEYWDIKKDVRDQYETETGRRVKDFEFLRDVGNESAAEFLKRYTEWNDDREVIRTREREAGIKEVMYSSIMDYGALRYTDWLGLGSYDKSAMRFMYGQLVDRLDCEQQNPEDCDLSEANRTHVKWYAGGLLCDDDGDCPSAADGQQCKANTAAGTTVCTSWDEDERDSGRFLVRQKFCSDDRVDDQPFCNRFDEGDSSEEIVRNMIEGYENRFVFANFRRFRSTISIGSYFQRIYNDFRVIGDQMQSVLYKYFYEPGFQGLEGPGSMDDMVRATIIGFEFLGNVLARPESGAYVWNEENEVFEQRSNLLHEVENDDNINVPLGLGKPLYSSYERGYFGEIERIAYIGTFYDKLAALFILTSRDFGTTSFNNEERFSLNFFDFFPDAFTELLGAFMTGDINPASMVYDGDAKSLVSRRYWDGKFQLFGREEGFSASDLVPEGRRIEPSASVLLGLYALIESAVNTPYYLDLSFKNSLRAFELGGETGFDIDEHNGVGGIALQDLSTYTSPLTHRTFVGVRTDGLPSISVRAVDRANVLRVRFEQLSQQIEDCRTVADCDFPRGMRLPDAENELDRLRNALSTQEDRLANLVQILDFLGIGGL